MGIASDYLDAFRVANPNTPVPDLKPTAYAGWFLLDGRRHGAKTLVDMTERLRNRAAGIAQLTNAELAALRASKPAHGSQEWAETYADDLGESPDY